MGILAYLLDLYNNPKTKNYSPTFKTRGLNMTYMNLGQTYLLKNSLDSSEYFFSKAIKGFQETNNWRFASSSLTNLGDVLFQKKEYERALIVLDSSQTIADNNKIKVNASKNYNLMARIHNKLGNEEAYNKYLELENKSRLKNLDKVTIGENNVSARKDNYKYELKPIYRIFQVREESPAEKLGIRQGDILVKINGVYAYNYSLQELHRKFYAKEKKKVRLLINRNGQELSFELVLEDLLN